MLQGPESAVSIATRPSYAVHRTCGRRAWWWVGINAISVYAESICSLKTEEKTERQCGQHGGFAVVLLVNSGSDTHLVQTKTKQSQKRMVRGYSPCPSQTFQNAAEAIQRVLDGEFDPGSGRTLAACLTHASRTGSMVLAPEDLVANG